MDRGNLGGAFLLNCPSIVFFGSQKFRAHRDPPEAPPEIQIASEILIRWTDSSVNGARKHPAQSNLVVKQERRVITGISLCDERQDEAHKN
jgi:hypothetical protein